MRQINRYRGTAVILCLLALVMGGCPTGDDSGGGRAPVQDGSYTTTGFGKSVTTPITVTTTFANNAIVDISVGNNAETGPILDSVKTLMLPRVIQVQTLGVDNVSGATYSSVGIKSAVAAAINEAGGRSDEWYDELPQNSNTIRLGFVEPYDVVVVGLGGSGMAAYVKASEQVNEKYPSVYGIEWAGKIGGNSATAGGPMAINSTWMKTTYNNGEDYTNRNALLKEWYSDMEADVPNDEIPVLTDFIPTYNNPGTTSYDVPAVTTRTPAYSGGPKWQAIKQLIDESGPTVDWLANPPYNFHFTAPGGLAYPQYTIVANYGSENWVNGGYQSDDGEDLFKTIMFTRAIETAKARNPKSGYKLELRATTLLTEGGRITGVKARYRDGSTYEVYGKTVILATGGYIGNSEMKMQYFGSDLREEAVHTDQGDGIKMAHNVGAGDYNIDMPATVHISQVKNIIYQPINSNAAKSAQWKATLTNLLTKGDSLLIGLKKGQAGDLRGQRFCNEAAFMAGGAAFENWKVGGYFASIYSNDVLESYKINGYEKTAMQFFLGQGQPIEVDTPITELDQILAEGEKYGNVVRAASLTELAQKLEIAEKAQTLRDTIIQYNKYVDGSATDNSFPKFMFGPPVPDPSFYTYQINPDATGYTAILGAGYYYGTGGGLDVDTDMQVLNTSKEKIPGLYAVGQDSMGVLFNAKKAYVGYGAAAQGWAITSGRIAGAKAAAAATQ